MNCAPYLSAKKPEIIIVEEKKALWEFRLVSNWMQGSRMFSQVLSRRHSLLIQNTGNEHHEIEYIT